MSEGEGEELELTILMPCRNEAATVGICVGEAKHFLSENGISGEILVVDNASEDASAALAREQGARILKEEKKGYGNALRTGIRGSAGRVIIMGDCDTTYSFGEIGEMYRLLAEGQCDMVIGNRFSGEMESGSMSLSHRAGVRFLSFCAGRRFHTAVRDFHCGLRGLTREAAETLTFHTTGMEFATEMIAEAARQGLRIRQLPVRLRRCSYGRESKLRTIRDGFRHLIYIVSG